VLEAPQPRSYAGAVAGRARGAPNLLRRWESLPTRVQGSVAFAVFAVVFFFINLAVFNQPLVRSILYGVIEALPMTALVVAATANERRKRESGGQDGS
jgi:hypothetical protein